jgi:hypothetical protein
LVKKLEPWLLEGILMLVRTVGIGLLAAVLVTGSRVVLAQASQLSVQEHVVNLKTALDASQANLRQYEWIETTIVSLKGEEKSRKQQRCYYGADGVLQKVVVDASPPPATKHGLLGKIIANKTAELTDYVQNAVSLVKSYLPPDPAKVQAAKNAGKVSIDVLEPGKRARLNFRDYQKPGDSLGIQIDLANNRVLGLTVSTYLNSPQEIVMLDMVMGQLTDGTIYASDTKLNAQAKDLTVTAQNSGYRKAN